MTKEEIEKAAKEYEIRAYSGNFDGNNPEYHFINGANTVNKKQPYTAEEMYLNMQYYMEYCLMKGYVTPMKWLEKYKHFGKEAAIRDKASQVGKEATE